MSRNRQLAWLGLAVSAVVLLLFSSLDDGGPSTDAERIQSLSESYACPECDGQTVAESNAAVAVTIREFIRLQVNDGATDAEIRDRLLRAYGTDVLLTPPADGFPVLIWILPALVLVLGVAGFVAVVRRTDGAGRQITQADRDLVEQARSRRPAGGPAIDEDVGDAVDRRLDPDRLLALQEERDFLLRSIDDLEAEWAADDIDDADYHGLKDDYTVRAAEVIRHLERHESVVAELPTARGSVRVVARVAGLGLLAVVVGFLLARASGERGVDDQITGSVDETVRDQVLRCQQLGSQADRLLDSLECFDGVLDRDPRNVEALTYRGWYVVLASGTAQQAGELDVAAELLASGVTFLDRAVEIDPGYPDARAFRAIVFERLGQSDQACAELEVLAQGETPPMIAQLTAPLAERLTC